MHFLQDSETAWALSEKLGSEHGCYNGAIRIYWPGFDPGRAPDYRTLILPERLSYRQVSLSAQVSAVLTAVLRKIAAVGVMHVAVPSVIPEAVTARREQQRLRDREHLLASLKGKVDDVAQDLIVNTIAENDARHKDEIDELRTTYEQNLASLATHYDREMEVEDEEDEEDINGEELEIEYFATSNKRRPVLDFADESLSRDRAASGEYLRALTKLPMRWSDASGERIGKVAGAHVATCAGNRADLWEYRAIQRKGAWVRVLFALVGHRAVLLHAVEKRQNQLDPNDINTAKERLKAYLSS